MKKEIKKLLLFFVLIFVFVILKNLSLQKEYYNRAERALNSGNYLTAIDYFERVYTSYVPFSPYNERSLEKIRLLCNFLSLKEDKIYCYETLKIMLNQVDVLSKPVSEMDKINKTVAKLKADLFREDFSQVDNKQLITHFLNIDSYTRDTSLWGFVVPVSLLGWTGFTVAGIWLRKRYFIGAFLFFILWIVALYLA